MKHSALSAIGGLLLLGGTAGATTWVVDPVAGPGVDFTTLQSAIGAAAPGDVILVHPGSYSGFVLSTGVSILGQSGVSLTGSVTVLNVPNGPRVTLAGLEMHAVKLSQCAAPVTLEDLVIRPTEAELASAGQSACLAIADCADVRVRNADVAIQYLTTRAALSVANSRVEVTHSTLLGSSGHSHDIYTYPAPPQNGGDGILADAGAQLHLSSSSVRGGMGGSLPSTNICFCSHAASGGAGIRIAAGASVIVTGPASASVAAGWQGVGNSCGEDGPLTNGIVVAAGGSLRVSGAAIAGGSSVYACEPDAPPIAGAFVQASPADPTLTVAGAAQAGQAVTFTVEGAPGSAVRLTLGRALVVLDLATAVEDQLTIPLRHFDLGILPGSGQATFPFTLPATLNPGTLLVFQARVGDPGGGLSLSQSVPLVLR